MVVVLRNTTLDTQLFNFLRRTLNEELVWILGVQIVSDYNGHSLQLRIEIEPSEDS